MPQDVLTEDEFYLSLLDDDDMPPVDEYEAEDIFDWMSESELRDFDALSAGMNIALSLHDELTLLSCYRSLDDLIVRASSRLAKQQALEED